METNKRKKKRAKSEVLLIICSMIIPVYVFILFYIVPNFRGFTLAFFDRHGNFTWDNFERVWQMLKSADSDLIVGFKNTFLAFAINVIKYPFSVMVPFFLYKKVPFHRIHRFLFFLPGIIMSVITSMVTANLLAPTGPIAEIVAQVMGMDYTPELLADSRFANIVLFVQMLWLSFPGDLIVWGGTFARIPTELLEAGRIDGVNWWQEFVMVVVPLVWPTVALQMVLMACGIFNNGTSAFLMTRGEYGTMTFGCWMELQMLAGSGAKYGSGVHNFMSAVGLCVTLIAVPLGMVVRKIAGKSFSEVEF